MSEPDVERDVVRCSRTLPIITQIPRLQRSSRHMTDTVAV